MATLLVLSGKNRGEWYTVPEHRPLVVGRDNTLLAELLDPCVSRRHMEVRYDADQQRYHAADLKSHNGVRVNGRKIDRPHPLAEDDIVQIGHTIMVFTEREFEDDREAQRYLATEEQRHQDLLDAVAVKAEKAHQSGHNPALRWMKKFKRAMKRSR